MKSMFMLLIFTVGQVAFAFQSPFEGTVEGLTIPNSHIVTGDNLHQIIRGQTPSEEQIDELLQRGVRQFLIFKIDTKGEVAAEVASLKARGVGDEKITHVSFPWKDIRDFDSVCRMTMRALQTIEQAAAGGESLFFHCTAGEDRTGYLASLWTLWSGAETSIRDSFLQQMCARGYEAGNPRKPYKAVVSKIRESLTPTYLKMLTILSQARHRGEGLDESLCNEEPSLQFKVKDFYCQR